MSHFNIKFKLIFGVVLTIFIFGVFAAFLTYFISRENTLKEEENDFRTIILLRSERVADVFEHTLQGVLQLAEHEDLKKFLLDPTRNKQDQNILGILERRNLNEAFSAIYLMASDGVTQVSTDPTFVGKNYGFREYFKSAISGQAYIDVAIGVTSLEPGYYFSVPIWQGDNVLGVLAMKQKPSEIRSIIHAQEQEQEQTIIFSDEYGVIVDSNEESLKYKSFGRLIEKEQEVLKEKKRYGDLEIRDLKREDIQSAIRAINGISAAPDEVFYKEKTMIGLSSIRGTKFSLVVEEDSVQFLLKNRFISLILAFIVALMACLASLVIVFIMNKFFIPFNSILLAIKRFSKDKCSKSLVIKTGDEFEDLANEFNGMAKTICRFEKDLAKQAETLEKKVSDLERVNKAMIGREKKMAELKEQIKKQNK